MSRDWANTAQFGGGLVQAMRKRSARLPDATNILTYEQEWPSFGSNIWYAGPGTHRLKSGKSSVGIKSGLVIVISTPEKFKDSTL